MPESKQIEQCKPGIPQTKPTTAPPFLLDIIISTSLPFSALPGPLKCGTSRSQIGFHFLVSCFVVLLLHFEITSKVIQKPVQKMTKHEHCSVHFLMTFGSHFEAQIGPKWFQDGPKMALEESWNGGTWRAYEKLAIILCLWRRKKGVG